MGSKQDPSTNRGRPGLKRQREALAERALAGFLKELSLRAMADREVVEPSQLFAAGGALVNFKAHRCQPRPICPPSCPASSAATALGWHKEAAKPIETSDC